MKLFPAQSQRTQDIDAQCCLLLNWSEGCPLSCAAKFYKTNMGFTPTNQITITRNFETRVIIVAWVNDVIGPYEKRFDFQDEAGAFLFAARIFKERAM